MIYQFITPEDIEQFVADSTRYISAIGKKDSVIIGLSRGGLVPAVYISHATSLPMIPVDYSAEEGRGTSAHTNIILPLDKYQTIYIVDDIVDTGKTVEFLKNLYESRGHIVHVLAVIEKNHSVIKCDLSIYKSGGSEWIVFPWEPEYQLYYSEGDIDGEEETQETEDQSSEGTT